MSTNTTSKSRKSTKSVASVNNVVENAFVPDMTKKQSLTAEEKMSAFFAQMSGSVVSTPVFAMPSNGEHSIVIMSYELKNGYGDNDDYFKLELKDVDKNITWGMTLPATAEDVSKFLGEVNMYNNGIIYGMSPLAAFGRLGARAFKVWTQQYDDDKGNRRVKTYSNPVKYENFARYLASKSAK